MKLQPESKKELLRIACGVSLCTAVMWMVSSGSCWPTVPV